MPAGFTYKLPPKEVQEERYDVESGVRRRGAYKLDTTGLNIGTTLPTMTPISADLVKKTAVVVINVKVAEKYTSGTTMKIEKGSLIKEGMHIGNGSNGATINSIDKSNANYDEITLAAEFGKGVEKGVVLFEAKEVSGKEPKNVANSALFHNVKVEEGIILVALLMRAFEIEPSKLVHPFSERDKMNLPHFQFNE